MNNTNGVGPFRVIEVKQKDGFFFTASLPAHDLVRIAYSDVRRLVDDERDIEKYLGVQRPINNARVRKIRDYILSPDPTFPTGIIIAVEEDCVSYDADTGLMSLLPRAADSSFTDTQEIPIEKIAKILDGQHRLAGFLNESGDYEINHDSFDLNVSIFVGADLDVQAQIFATVNLAQTKVSKSLVYELEELSQTRSPFNAVHNIAVALDRLPSSPFYKRIKRLGYVTPGRTGETITQAAFVESVVRLISVDPFADRNRYFENKPPKPVLGRDLERTPFRNLFLEGKDFDIADNIDNYFSAVRENWPQAWADTSRKSGILPKTNAFRAFVRHLRDVYPKLSMQVGSEVVSKDKYLSVLEECGLRDGDLTTRNFRPGSSGESAFYRVLSGEVSPDELFE
jgi:DGQHR domain-containing protein